MPALFDPTDFGKLTARRVNGFDKPIPAICYRGNDLKSPFPIGGVATGYLELRGDGQLGLTSLYNNYVPPMQAASGGALLTLIAADGSETPLDAEHSDIAILAHFPVCNVRYAVKNGGPVVWLRVFTPIVPGDSETSNTPGAVFEVSTENFTGDVRIEIALAHNVESVTKPIDLAQGLFGAGRRYFKGDDYRASFVLAWTDGLDGSGEASGERVRLRLRGSCRAVRRAVFSWHLPVWIDSGGEPHQNRYATRFNDATDVATFLKNNASSLLARIVGWQNAIYAANLPDWISNALVQSLYSYAKNTVWVDERRGHGDRWYEDNGFFVHSESFRGCPIAETMVCRQHGHIATLLLWPELERTTLAGFAHFQNRQGEIPFSFGQPNALRDPRFHCQHPLTSSQFIQQVHRFFARTGDEKFVKRLWSNVVDAMKYCEVLDDDHDSLVNEQAHALPGDHWPANQFYDQWPWHGTSSYVAGTGLAAVAAFAALADRMGDHDAHAAAVKKLAAGIASFKKKLWNGSYFRLWHDDKLGDNETCLANQLMGQWCCRVAGLDPLFDADTCRKVYESIDKLNAAPTRFGLINGGDFQGNPNVAGDPNNNHGTMIFVGENLCAAMTGMYENYPAAQNWAETLVRTTHEHEAMPFDQHCLIRHDNGAPAWGNDYYSNLVVWALPLAHQKVGLAEFARKGGLMDRMGGSA